MADTASQSASTLPRAGDWPIGDATQMGGIARDRVAAAMMELYLPERGRLTDEQRGRMAGLLGRLIDSVEDAVRAAMMPFMGARHDVVRSAIATPRIRIARPILEGSRALADPALIEVILRRCDEQHLSRLLRLDAEAAGEIPAGLIERFIITEDEALPALAIGYLVAESRRLDQFSDPVIARSDLPAEIQHRMAWRVAAALRAYLVGQHGVPAGEADAMLSPATEQVLVDHDESAGFEAATQRLVRRLHKNGWLGDGLIVDALADARPGIAMAAIALRARVPTEVVWDMAVDGDTGRLGLMLRAIRMERVEAGAILDRLDRLDQAGVTRLDVAMAAYDMHDSREAEALIAPFRLDPAYRAAIVQIGGGQIGSGQIGGGG